MVIKELFTALFFSIILFCSQSIHGFENNNQLDTLPFELYEEHILYVGGIGPNNYSTIQEAVNNASNGDTVYVYSGFYVDYYPSNQACVKIHKSIKLIGEDKNTTIIDGQENRDVIRIGANHIEISGFTIQNSSRDGNIRGRGIDQFFGDAKYYKIYNNIIRDNYYGIFNDLVTNCMIFNNIFSENKYGLLIRGENTSIFSNIIIDNRVGVDLNTHSINIQGNQFERNEKGIVCSESYATIRENNFIDNDIHAEYSNLINLPIVGRNTWRNNYWDDWRLPIPKPIRGYWAWLSLIMMDIIGPFPGFQFDWRPVTNSYDIEVV
jgi:hypothetical protein